MRFAQLDQNPNQGEFGKVFGDSHRSSMHAYASDATPSSISNRPSPAKPCRNHPGCNRLSWCNRPDRSRRLALAERILCRSGPSANAGHVGFDGRARWDTERNHSAFSRRRGKQRTVRNSSRKKESCSRADHYDRPSFQFSSSPRKLLA